jgi:hypothetical protein
VGNVICVLIEEPPVRASFGRKNARRIDSEAAYLRSLTKEPR